MPKSSTINIQKGATARKLFASRNTANATRQGKSAVPIANAKSAKMDMKRVTASSTNRKSIKTR
jgi:hypothetical protein